MGEQTQGISAALTSNYGWRATTIGNLSLLNSSSRHDLLLDRNIIVRAPVSRCDHECIVVASGTTRQAANTLALVLLIPVILYPFYHGSGHIHISFYFNSAILGRIHCIDP